MRRIMLRVAYDGTKYCGWQRQPNGITVEGMLNNALCALLKENIEIIGASRTDAGVHARGNVCVFDTGSRIPAEKFAHALNPRLPDDIVVQESRAVAADFHPRHCNCEKTYEYQIYNATFPNPLLRRYSHFLYRPLDVEAMQQAAGYLVGEHDFKSFCSVNTQVKETVRCIYFLEVLSVNELGDCGNSKTVSSFTQPVCAAGANMGRLAASAGRSMTASVNEPGDCGNFKAASSPEISKFAPRMVVIRINGNGFLYNMVRIIAGTLIEVGLHQRSPESLNETLGACDRQAAGPTAPACGLTLVGIHYDGTLLSGGKTTV